MACDCRDSNGELASRCYGTCKKQAQIIAYTKPYSVLKEKLEKKHNIVPVVSPYLFQDGLKLIGYDKELQNSIKLGLLKQPIPRNMQPLYHSTSMEAQYYLIISEGYHNAVITYRFDIAIAE